MSITQLNPSILSLLPSYMWSTALSMQNWLILKLIIYPTHNHSLLTCLFQVDYTNFGNKNLIESMLFNNIAYTIFPYFLVSKIFKLALNGYVNQRALP